MLPLLLAYKLLNSDVQAFHIVRLNSCNMSLFFVLFLGCCYFVECLLGFQVGVGELQQYSPTNTRLHTKLKIPFNLKNKYLWAGYNSGGDSSTVCRNTIRMSCDGNRSTNSFPSSETLWGICYTRD